MKQWKIGKFTFTYKNKKEYTEEDWKNEYRSDLFATVLICIVLPLLLLLNIYYNRFGLYDSAVIFPCLVVLGLLMAWATGEAKNKLLGFEAMKN